MLHAIALALMIATLAGSMAVTGLHAAGESHSQARIELAQRIGLREARPQPSADQLNYYRTPVFTLEAIELDEFGSAWNFSLWNRNQGQSEAYTLEISSIYAIDERGRRFEGTGRGLKALPGERIESTIPFPPLPPDVGQMTLSITGSSYGPAFTWGNFSSSWQSSFRLDF